jgi:hypothetical protein
MKRNEAFDSVSCVQAFCSTLCYTRAGNFGKKPELYKVQRESNDKNLGILRAAVSRSYTVDSLAAWQVSRESLKLDAR